MKEVPSIEQFYAAYQAGSESPTLAGRQSSFNEALTHLQELQLDTGAYYYDMGNVYYQLDQYPWALFYYMKAGQMLPRDSEVKKNIRTTMEKLELKQEVAASWIPVSESEELALAQLLIIATGVLFSLRIWASSERLKFVSRVTLALTFFCLIFIASRYYFTPEKGVLAKAAILYKTPEMKSERVYLDPLPPGTVLEIIGEADGGDWAKTVNKEGVVGYVQTDHLIL